MGKVLLVDDSELARYLMSQILISGGHEVVGEASDGIEALQKVRETSPDVVILDVIMPKMRGPETLEEIRKISPATRVIICSGDHQEHTVRDVVRKGASGFIIKPFKKDAVLQEINSVLAGQAP
ncbi:MAG: transcriptional regulator NarL [Methanoregulaceae archaeon PtaB.Bin056]|jgi:two-component system chemotaxis response regulator CheY|nr:MAG: transcriptional regulator NarL [Methanoregulaceae archaeon PtaB.Bin056]